MKIKTVKKSLKQLNKIKEERVYISAKHLERYYELRDKCKETGRLSDLLRYNKFCIKNIIRWYMKRKGNEKEGK